jgi:hypothetical protein
MAESQGNAPRRVLDLVAQCRVEWKAGNLGVSEGQIATALRGLHGFVQSARLSYSAVDERLGGTPAVTGLVAMVES